jgi:hypothetical protein
VERRDASTESRTAARGTARAGARWAAALAVAGLALTGCGAGQVTQTDRKTPAVDGVHVDAGPLALRDMHVDFSDPGGYPEGGTAPLRVWIANEGEETVVLEGVTSPDAEVVTLVGAEGATGPTEIPPGGSPASPDGDPAEPTDEGEESPGADASETPGADASETPSADASATPGDGESPTATASETPQGDEGAGAPSGERDFTIELAPGSHVRLEPESGSYLLLEGLSEELTAASTVEVVFLFSNGEAVTADLPMGEPAEAQSRSYFEGPDDEH